MSAHIEGYEAPLHRALTEPILLGGSPRGLAIVVGLDPATGDYRVLSAGAGGDPMLPGEPS